jgi:hypothetical protein
MYIIGGEVYEDEEIMSPNRYLSVYEEDPDEYIDESDDMDVMDEMDEMSILFLEKMNVKTIIVS